MMSERGATAANAVFLNGNNGIDLDLQEANRRQAGFIFTRQEEAACTIQRAYRMYRLRNVINDLYDTEPWFFNGWKTCSNQFNQQQYSIKTLQKKFSDEEFFKKITKFFQLLGEKADLSDVQCRAKMLLIAFMLNQHANQSLPLSKNVQCLGMTFLKVCERPTCWFNRIQFFCTYSCFYWGFLDSKYKNASIRIPQILSNVTKGIILSNLSRKNKKHFDNIAEQNRYLNRIQTKTANYMNTLNRLVGSSDKAMELVRQEIFKKIFLDKLNKHYYDMTTLTSAIDPSDKHNRQYRAIGLQLIISNGNQFKSAHIQSREAKYDCYKHSSCSVMRNHHHYRLDYIKQLVRFNYNSNKQCDWLPEFVSHVRSVLSTFNKTVNIDDECFQSQCTRNCYEPDELVKYVLCVIKQLSLTHYYRDYYQPLIDTLETQLDSNNNTTAITTYCTKSILISLLDILDDLRVDNMDLCFSLNSNKLIDVTTHNELRFFMEDLASQRMGIKNLVSWAKKSAVTRPPADDRLKAMVSEFSKMMTWFPTSSNLDAFPETFKLIRLIILRTLILVKDTVTAFTILHFIIILSGDSSHICKLKQGILKLLRDESNIAQSEMVPQLFDLILTERPCLSEDDKKMLKSVICRIIRKPETTAMNEQVPKLALTRIQHIIQNEIENNESSNPPLKLTYFEKEVKEISENCKSIFNLSMEIYHPIYQTILHLDEIWKK